MWAFAAGHQEILPIGLLTPAAKKQFDNRISHAAPVASDRSELYATLLDAYKEMRKGYDPTRPNLIVVLTDGGDSDPGGLRREKFSQDVQKLADPTKPVRIVLIGINVDSGDAADLDAIAKIVGGAFFPLTSPEQIQTIFLKALLQVGSSG
jgi:Mg-chelatase subunit ChlD